MLYVCITFMPVLAKSILFVIVISYKSILGKYLRENVDIKATYKFP